MAMPSGYKRLEYIQSSGTQYVDTEFRPKNTTKVMIDFQVTAQPKSHQIIFGERTSYRDADQFVLGYTGHKSPAVWRSDFGSSQVSFPSTVLWSTRMTAVQNGPDCTLDGTAVKNSSAVFSSTHNLFLLANNDNETAAGHISAKLYLCQISDGEKIARFFIPCQTAGGEIGLWDDVNGVFYGNAGTGTFEAGPVVAIAADSHDVTELEYIQSSGTQWTDTGFKPTGATKVVIDFQMVSQGSSQQGVFGSRPVGSGRFTVFTGTSTSALQVDYGTESTLAVPTSSITGVNTNNRTTIDVSNSLIINGTTIKTVSAVSFTSTYNLFLFANNNAGTAQLPGAMKLYSCQIYDNGTIIRDYIAAKLSDGTVGLYDKLHGLLYINVGSGDFTAGPEVPKAPTTPTGFAAAFLTETTVQLSWSASDEATGYKLYKNGVLLATLTDTSYTDTVQAFSGTVYAVTAYNDDGESAAATLTYYAAPENPILYLVTDRTAADVNAGNDKGTYKASDLNRVGAAMNYVAARLREQGYDPHISPKTDWMDGEWVTPADEAVYLGDLAELRKQFTMMASTPEVPPDLEKLNYIEANSIEQILVDIDALLTNIAAGWLYSGEIYSGEV